MINEIIKRKEIPSPFRNIRNHKGAIQYVKFRNNNLVYFDDETHCT